MAEQMLWRKCATAARACITSLLQAESQWKAMLDFIFDNSEIFIGMKKTKARAAEVVFPLAVQPSSNAWADLQKDLNT